MGIETKETVIGNHTFKVSQLPASKARKLLVRLFKVAGPSLGKVLESLKGKNGKTGLNDLNLGKISEGLALLANNVFEDDFEYVVNALLEGERIIYHVDGKWPVLSLETSDILFAGKLDQMFKLIAFALEVNFSSFFAGSGGLTNAIKRAGEAVTPEPLQSSSPAS
ncbi:hypothetical protein LCGC14_0375450 [marine sediment metagenome]|uniref:Uncharacterized protein n=1 Tax=marine sediment metagenome TaxID=412755 RepID=A0A0F9WCR2_9ZZZZ